MHKMTKLIEARQILKSLVISYFHLVVRLFFLISIFIRPHQRRIHSFVLSSISTSLFLFLFLSLCFPLSLFLCFIFPFSFVENEPQYTWTEATAIANTDTSFFPSSHRRKRHGRASSFLRPAAARSVRLIDAFFIHHRSN